MGLADKTGAVVARYTYDAWGKVLSITDADGNEIDANRYAYHIAHLNPIRYRGYYYDTETGLYYLQSRYYDPEVGRFINADDVIVESNASLAAANLFIYCLNNPLNMIDNSGLLPKWLKAAATAVAAVAVVAVIAVAAPVAAPVIAGAAVGAGVSAAVDVGIQLKTTGKVDVCQTVTAASFGAVSGAVGGSGVGRVGQIAANATLSAVQTAASDWQTGNKSSATTYLLNTATGAAAGWAGGTGAQVRQQAAGQIGKQIVRTTGPIISKQLIVNAMTKASIVGVVRSTAGSGIASIVSNCLDLMFKKMAG